MLPLVWMSKPLLMSSPSSSSLAWSPWFLSHSMVRPSLMYSSLMMSSPVKSSLAISMASAMMMPSLAISPSNQLWDALILSSAKQGEWEHTLSLYEKVQEENSMLTLSEYTFVILLKACIHLKDIKRGNSIYSEIARKGLFETNIFIGSTLVHMYAKFGMPKKAKEAFDRLKSRNIVLWTSLINGFAQHGLGQEALECFEEMQEDGFSPNATTFSCILKVCSALNSINKGLEIHAMTLMEGLSGDLLVGNTLIDMYVTCGLFVSAQTVLQNLLVRDTISWTILIRGYVQHGHCKEGLFCFEEMQLEGLSPNMITFVEILKCYCNIGELSKGQDVHSSVVKMGLERELVLGSFLIAMYARFFFLDEVELVFQSLLVRDIVSWNALIEAYVECGCGEEALACLKHMQFDGFSPSGATFAHILKACATIGAKEKGEEIFYEISLKGLLERDIFLGNSLIHMYTSVAMLTKAYDVFERLPVRDVVSWNCLITGFAHMGECREAFLVFNEMVGTRKQKPNLVTFLNILGACSHGGLIREAQSCLQAMSRDYDFIPTLEHYTYLADLLGRSGQLDLALCMAKNLQCPTNLGIWRTLLGACQKWCDRKIGVEVFEAATCLDKKDAMPYVCMSNIYANAGLCEDANNIEASRMRNQARNFLQQNS